MASEDVDLPEKIARMTEWNETEAWEYTEQEAASDGNTLAAAKRFVAAQAFLLSWKEGKVPTGWRRARKLTDFDGEYPQHVVDAAEELISERISERNLQKTAKLNAVVSSKTKSNPAAGKNHSADVTLTKQQIESLKMEFSKFNHDFFEVKSALSKATTALAEISLRIQAVSEIVSE